MSCLLILLLSYKKRFQITYGKFMFLWLYLRYSQAFRKKNAYIYNYIKKENRSQSSHYSNFISMKMTKFTIICGQIRKLRPSLSMSETPISSSIDELVTSPSPARTGAQSGRLAGLERYF